MASSSTTASPNTSNSYHVFINHRGLDVKKTFAAHLYSALLSHGLRAFMDNKELKVGENFPSQIIEAITNASVHVGIFSERYAESEWCLRELVYMLDSGAPIVPVFYHVEPAVLRWTQGRGLYAEALGKLEEKKTRDPETHEEKRRYDPSTIEKWREALSRVSEISGLDLQVTCNGDEGELVRKIVQHVLERIKSMAIGISEFYCSQEYGCPGGLHDWSDGTYSGIRRISLTKNDNSLTSVQLHYGLEGDESVNGKYIRGLRHGNADGSPIEYNLNYPEEFVTKISGYFGQYVPHKVLISLTFHTNQRKLGPCGAEVGPSFETEVGGKIVGLFGSSGDLVDSIGVYMLKPRSSEDDLSESESD